MMSSLRALALSLATREPAMEFNCVVGLLAAQGVLSSDDLALIGEGDEMPESVVEAILGQQVAELREPLMLMFGVARSGLEGGIKFWFRRVQARSNVVSET